VGQELDVNLPSRTDRLRAARAEFLKAGLIITDEFAIEINPMSSMRWEEVSQYVRVAFRMPPTTNSLESILGHLNEATPRRNEFWSSMRGIVEHIDEGMKRFFNAVRHNFNYVSRATSQSTQCSCGDMLLLSTMYDIAIPCCHMIHCGTERPRMGPPPVLKLGGYPGPDRLQLTFHVRQRVRGPLDHSRVASLKKLAIGGIHHSSRTKRTKKEVTKWVGDNWPKVHPPSYMLGYLIPCCQ
jgi:hypothetical protein